MFLYSYWMLKGSPLFGFKTLWFLWIVSFKLSAWSGSSKRFIWSMYNSVGFPNITEKKKHIKCYNRCISTTFYILMETFSVNLSCNKNTIGRTVRVITHTVKLKNFNSILISGYYYMSIAFSTCVNDSSYSILDASASAYFDPHIHTYIHTYVIVRTYSLTLTPNNRFFKKLFHGRFIYSQSFYQRSAERKSLKKYFSYFIFSDCLGIRTQATDIYVYIIMYICLWKI